jgi:hypothetical protein
MDDVLAKFLCFLLDDSIPFEMAGSVIGPRVKLTAQITNEVGLGFSIESITVK